VGTVAILPRPESEMTVAMSDAVIQ